MPSGEPSVSVEIWSGAIRVHLPGGRHGDPYTWSCGFTTADGGGTIVLGPTAGAPPMSVVHVMLREFARYRFKVMRWERKTERGARFVNFKIPAHR